LRTTNGIALRVTTVYRAQKGAMSQVRQQSTGVEDQNNLLLSSKSAQMATNSFLICPEEDEPIQESVPVGRSHAVTEHWRQQMRRHRLLIAYENSVAKNETIGAMTT